VDSIKHTTVLGVIPSPKNILAHIANVNIPAANPKSLPGHITPSKATNPNLVASMYSQLIGIPNRHNRNILFLNHGHMN
tara:strand:+ start:228 stop:464 length:237 start_codon:yes stop_codon:yes gene_type:complete